MARGGSKDPVSVIRSDHKVVEGLFKEFENARSPDRKQNIVIEVTTELMNHTTLEEELFYPAAGEAGIGEEFLTEADEEHHVVETIMSELEDMSPDDENYDAKFKVLMENVLHHVEEEKNMLKKLAGSKKLPDDLGERMMRRKEELKAEHPSPTQITR